MVAKTKVAPKKALSVARLELQAALLGPRRANYVKAAMTRRIDRLVFCTNSKCVIGWVGSVWYKPFVAHQVGEIKTLTDPKSWRHALGRLNVSYCATRSRFDGDVIYYYYTIYLNTVKSTVVTRKTIN